METVQVLLPLLLITSKYVCSLKCYITTFETLEAFNKSAQPVVKDCKLHMEELLKKKHITLPWQYWENNLRCYSMSVRVKFPTLTNTEEIDIRRCSFKNSCENFMDKIKLEMLTRSIVGIIKCSECYGNLCNSRITHDLFKMKAKKSSYNRNLYIGAGGCGVVAVIGALARCLFYLKSKNEASVPLPLNTNSSC